MTSHEKNIRTLRLVQLFQIVILVLTPIPLVWFYNFLKQPYPANEWFYGLGQFVGTTCIELALAISSLCLLVKVYRMGQKWTAKTRKVLYWSSGLAILVLYAANVNILIILPCVISTCVVTTLIWVQKIIQRRNVYEHVNV